MKVYGDFHKNTTDRKLKSCRRATAHRHALEIRWDEKRCPTEKVQNVQHDYTESD